MMYMIFFPGTGERSLSMNSLKRLILAFAAMLLVCLCAVGAADSAAAYALQ